MAEALQFDLVSPERLLMSAAVQQVVVPGSEGEMTVLVNHAPVMTTLKPGLLVITGEDGEREEIFVRGGFADINADGLTILAEMAIPMAELTPEALAEEIRLAEQELEEAGEHHARQSAARKKIGDLDSFKRWKIPA